LGDVPIHTILYAVLVVGASDCRTQKEIVPVSRPLAALASLGLMGLSLLVLLPDCAIACSCGGFGTKKQVEWALSHSGAVFSGEVVDVEDGPPISYSGIDLPSSDVTLQVSEVWKGPQRETLEVITERADGVSCGYPFEEGQEYLVYASGKGEPFETDICSGTTPLSKAEEDLALLGNGEKPKDGGDALTDTSGVVPARAVVGLAGLAMAASLLVMVRLVRSV
jgi:hypothetical protein